jgi:Icc protein
LSIYSQETPVPSLAPDRGCAARPPSPGVGALLVQLTDAHLFADIDARMLGADVRANLVNAVRQVGDDWGTPDLVLVTGDISHDGSTESYRHFAQTLAPLTGTIRVIPGNHDDPDALRAVLSAWTATFTDIGQWRVITLDSTVRDNNAGRLSAAQWARFDAALASAGDRHILLALHHNLLPAEYGYDDKMMLMEAPAALLRLRASGRVRVVLWGHVHQEFDERIDGLRLLATPATSFQFAVRDGQHCVDNLPPGYRWLRLHDNGSIETGVTRLARAMDCADVCREDQVE